MRVLRPRRVLPTQRGRGGCSNLFFWSLTKAGVVSVARRLTWRGYKPPRDLNSGWRAASTWLPRNFFKPPTATATRVITTTHFLKLDRFFCTPSITQINDTVINSHAI